MFEMFETNPMDNYTQDSISQVSVIYLKNIKSNVSLVFMCVDVCLWLCTCDGCPATTHSSLDFTW